MQSLRVNPSNLRTSPAQFPQEVARLKNLLGERRRLLVILQDELRVFRTRYLQVIGSRLDELQKIERAIRAADEKLLGRKLIAEEKAAAEHDRESSPAGQSPPTTYAGNGLRKLFWSVAKLFHPDPANDEMEAPRRHAGMAAATRA